MRKMHDEKTINAMQDQGAENATEISELQGAVATKATLSDVETLLASGDVDAIKADSIVENMTGYSASLVEIEGYTFEGTYLSAVKNGNKLTLVFASSITRTASAPLGNPTPVIFTIPAEINAKLYKIGSWESVDLKYLPFFNSQGTAPTYKNARLWKYSTTQLYLQVYGLDALTLNAPYYVRYEATFLLSDNMAETE